MLEHQTGKRCLHDLTCLQKRCIERNATELCRMLGIHLTPSCRLDDN